VQAAFVLGVVRNLAATVDLVAVVAVEALYNLIAEVEVGGIVAAAAVTGLDSAEADAAVIAEGL